MSVLADMIIMVKHDSKQRRRWKPDYWRLAFLLLTGSLWLEWQAPLVAALADLVVNADVVNPFIVQLNFSTNDCNVVEGCVPEGPRQLLLFTTQVENRGTADVHLGAPSTNSLFHWSPCHGHYHFDHFAQYNLVDATTSIVVAGRKTAFCLEDGVKWDAAAPNPYRRYDCNDQGIQVGWADVYGTNLPCQWLDITGVRGGNYFLQITANPDGVISESDFGNNTITVPITIPEICQRPPNDFFANARPILFNSTTIIGYNGCATNEPNEPFHAGNTGGHSLWYSWTAPANLTAEVNTLGSDFDTLLAVYQGDDLNNLALIQANDDIVPFALRQSRVRFPASAGATYKIAVDGYSAAFGQVVLNLNPPPNDFFTNCQVISGSFGTVTGYNTGATKELSEPDHAGNLGSHSVWYCWTAPLSGVVALDTVGSDFPTVMGVYTGSSFERIENIEQDNGSGPNQLAQLTFDAVAATTYAIAVDGFFLSRWAKWF